MSIDLVNAPRLNEDRQVSSWARKANMRAAYVQGGNKTSTNVDDWGLPDLITLAVLAAILIAIGFVLGRMRI